MTIRADSYSNVTGVLSWTRFHIEGQTNFNTTTRPTKTEVEDFIDEASGVLNVALSKQGFTGTNVIANSTAKLACDNWVRGWAVSFVELSHPMGGMGGEQKSRVELLQSMNGSANEFAIENAKGFKNLGITQTKTDANVISFTGETVQANRADPDDTSLEQPKFKRGQFDNNV